MTTVTTTEIECPKCRNKGKTVKALTLCALLEDKFADQVADADFGSVAKGIETAKSELLGATPTGGKAEQ